MTTFLESSGKFNFGSVYFLRTILLQYDFQVATLATAVNFFYSAYSFKRNITHTHEAGAIAVVRKYTACIVCLWHVLDAFLGKSRISGKNGLLDNGRR